MRALVFVLVLANVLFFAYAEGYFGRPDNPDADRLARQIEPESIRIVARDGPAPAREGGGERRAQAAASESEVPPVPVCLAWSGLPAADADRLAGLLGERFPDFSLSRRAQPGDSATWWVFIPPLPGKADADRKVSELARLGVEDYFIVQEVGPNRFAISLGVFSSEAGASERLAALKAKGVRSARVSLRAGKGGTQLIEARGPAGQESALREAVAALLPDSRQQVCK